MTDRKSGKNQTGRSDAMDETEYLLSSEANAAWLRQSIAQLRAKDCLIEKTMDELRRMAE